MKVLLISSLLFATTGFAQSLDVQGLKKLMTERQALLEKINPGMSKAVKTVTRYPTELGPCEVTESAVQTVLKIEGEKIIVHSKEKYVPATTDACSGFEQQETAVVFYEEKPTLANDLTDLDQTASQIKSILRAGNIITMNLNAEVSNEVGSTATTPVTVKYDLSKPSFKNTVLIQDTSSTITSEDIADIDVNTIDLKYVFFCESAESETCSEGDFSDILF